MHLCSMIPKLRASTQWTNTRAHLRSIACIDDQVQLRLIAYDHRLSADTQSATKHHIFFSFQFGYFSLFIFVPVFLSYFICVLYFCEYFAFA
jgi:hypothetical protein